MSTTSTISTTMSATKVFLTGAVSLCLVIPGFHAASAEALNADTLKSERNYRKTKDGEGALTQEMLEECIVLKAEIDEEFEKISVSKEEFDTLNKEVTELETHLKKNKEQLDNQDIKAVNEHNDKVTLYNQKLEELEKIKTAYNEKSGPYQTRSAQLEKECNGQPYYEDDYEAAVKATGKTL